MHYIANNVSEYFILSSVILILYAMPQNYNIVPRYGPSSDATVTHGGMNSSLDEEPVVTSKLDYVSVLEIQKNVE